MNEEMTPTAKEDLKKPEKGWGCKFCTLYAQAPDFDPSAYCRNMTEKATDSREAQTNRTRFVPSDGSRSPKILFVGEAPGADEDRDGKPFVGESGRVLRAGIEKAGLMPREYRITNTVRCRPLGNKTPTFNECKACSGFLGAEIAFFKPEIIVPLGSTALKAIMGDSTTGVQRYIGPGLVTKPFTATVAGHECLIWPMYHPSWIISYNTHLSGEYGAGFLTLARFLHEKAGGDGPKSGVKMLETDPLKNNGRKWIGLGKNGDEDIPKILGIVRRMRDARKPISFDFEASRLSPYTRDAKLLCIGICNEERKGYAIPLDHKECRFSPEGKKVIRKALREMLADPALEFTGQNVSFDVRWSAVKWGVRIRRIIEDSMLTHHGCDERQGIHGLDNICREYFPEVGPYWQHIEKWYENDKMLKRLDRGKSLADAPLWGPLGILRYCAADVDMTLCANARMRPQVEREGLGRTVWSLLPRMSLYTADLQRYGVAIDVPYARDFEVRLSRMVRDSYDGLMSAPEIIKYNGIKIQILREDREKEIERFKTEANKVKARAKLGELRHEFNPNSPDQVAEVMYDMLGLASQEEDTGRGESRSTDEDHLTWLAVKSGAKIAKDIIAYRKLTKIEGTYSTPIIQRVTNAVNNHWGYLHGGFLLHGTVTGRLSSADPNMQNIPGSGVGKDIKRFIISRYNDGLFDRISSELPEDPKKKRIAEAERKGLPYYWKKLKPPSVGKRRGVLLSADYSQIELRFLAALANDKAMIRVYREGIPVKDLHRLTCCKIFDITPEQYSELEHSEQKRRRRVAKAVNFGVAYGGGPGALMASLASDEIYIDFREAKGYIDGFYSGYPGVAKFVERTYEIAHEQEYVTSVFGRRRRLPEINSLVKGIRERAERQALNFLIQSPASGDVTSGAQTIIAEELERKRLWTIPIMTVHDSIVFDAVEEEVPVVIPIVRDIMENIFLPKYSDRVWGPGVDWSFLNGVPLVADFEIGYNWRDSVGVLNEDKPDERKLGDHADNYRIFLEESRKMEEKEAAA